MFTYGGEFLLELVLVHFILVGSPFVLVTNTLV